MRTKSFYRNQILQEEPIFSDEYLKEILQLPTGNRIVSKQMIEDRKTDTTRIIKMVFAWMANDEEKHIEKLFIKLPIVGKQNNAFDKWTKHEIDFYRHMSRNNDLPIVKSHDAYIFDDNTNFLLVLDDISSDYCSINEIDRNDMDNWLMAAGSLAKLHSFYWNGHNADKLKLIQGDNKSLKEKVQYYQDALTKFLTYATDLYNMEILDVYQSVLEDAIIFENNSINRREHSKNISVINGDSHIYNFMFPKALNRKPLIVDFQFWRMGIPTIDIMNLTRVAFPFMQEPEYHFKILKHYHASLLEYGITNYSVDECLNDYVLSVAMGAFGPVFNYFDFGLGHEYWGQGVYDTINNYKTVKRLLS